MTAVSSSRAEQGAAPAPAYGLLVRFAANAGRWREIVASVQRNGDLAIA